MFETGAANFQQQLNQQIDLAAAAITRQQQPDGHWCYQLEADCTIPAEYILMMHHMDEVDEELQQRFARYLRSKQNEEGGWPLYQGGKIDISCSVKCYYALKIAGDDVEAPHMVAARKAIRVRGGAAKANVFTRLMLAMFQQIPWKGTPFIPVEIMLFPKWFFFHLDKVAYWSRTVMVPLFILCSLRVKARNPTGTDCQELFVTPPHEEKNWFVAETFLAKTFLYLDECARLFEPLIPRFIRWKAIRKAEAWFIERLNGEDGLGAIFPAMVNAYEAMDLLGYPQSHPQRQIAKKALEKLIVYQGELAYCQPCVSPIWDTGLACHALLSADESRYSDAITASLQWLKDKQILDVKGDWVAKAEGVEPGGWAFQYDNDYYPDLDDTAVVAWAMDRVSHRDGPGEKHGEAYRESINKAANWLKGTQSRNGGFAAFDVDNTHTHLNEIPFADHGALLDPPTADVSGRCLALLGRLNQEEHQHAIDECISYLKKEQEADGAWFGRWGTNYIYGTWSVLTALAEAGIDSRQSYIKKAASWLKDVQRPDGGWGEDNDSYEVKGTRKSSLVGNQGSTSYQTAWALLALIAAGEAESDAVKRGVDYLLSTQNEDGLWKDPWFTAPGFPRVFYLKYHGYSEYFPLWALAEYRNSLARGDEFGETPTGATPDKESPDKESPDKQRVA